MNLLVRGVACLVGIILTAQCLRNADHVTVWRAAGAIGLAAILLWANKLKGVRAVINQLDLLPNNYRLRLACIIFFSSIAYYSLSAVMFDRGFHPTWHDDQMHAVQAQMLATGHLWLPPHPMHQFFDTFHIFMTPVYAPIHFPGTAIINVAAVWLGISYAVIPLLLMSGACAMGYLVLSEVISGAAGLVVVAFFWACPEVRMISTMAISHNAMIFIGALLIWLFIRWQKNPTLGWSIALGCLVGLAAITRPVDALAYGIPIGCAVLFEAFKRPRLRLFALVMLFCTLPFLGLQLIFDHGVTGKWLKAPYQAYNDRFHPFSSYASVRLEDLSGEPVHVSDLPQKQIYYQEFVLPRVREYVQQGAFGTLWNTRLSMTFGTDLPLIVLIFFAPIGVLALNSTVKWVVAAPAILFLILYLPHVFYLSHYPPIILLSMSALCFFGVHHFSNWCAAHWSTASQFTMAASSFAAVVAMSPLSFIGGFEYTTAPFSAVNFVYEQLPKRVQQPALVFCRMYANANIHDEPVYNTSNAWPDDATIVLAQSLGPQNIDLIRYYAGIHQNRHVYEFSRQTLSVIDKGTVNEILAGAAPSTVPASQPTTTTPTTTLSK